MPSVKCHMHVTKMKMKGVLVALVEIVFVHCKSILFYCFIVQEKTEISDNHVSGYSRHGGTLM